MDIPFPSQYKYPILNGKKNITIRLGNELGKYKEGSTYSTVSYSGTDWGTYIQVQKINTTMVKNLKDFNIPQTTIASLLKKQTVAPTTRVELIKFKALKKSID